MAPRRRIHLELSPGRLALRAADAPVVVEFDESIWERAWDEDLRPLDATLREAIERAAIAGGDAIISHRGPTAIAEVFSYPVGPARALDAARLALADALGRPLDSAVWSLRILDTSRADPPQTVVLAAGDTIENAERLARWAARAGLTPTDMSPADAGALALVASRLTALKGDAGRALLHLDDAAGAFGARSRGRLAFVRCLGIGLDQFVAALTRPIQRSSGGAITLSREDARALLARHGIPSPDDVLDDARALKGADVLPLLQPVLQRLMIEVKQSLRFGLDDEARHGVEVSFIGPGSAVPRLAQTIAGAVDRPVSVADAADQKPSRTVAMSTLAPSAAGAVATRRAAWSLRFGAAAAALVMGGQFVIAQRAADAARDRAAALEASAEQAQQAIDAEKHGQSLAVAVGMAEERLARAFGSRADWLAVLRELAARTPDSIRFSEFGAQYESGAPMATLQGVALVDESSAPDAPGPLMDYVEALRRSPLVERVELGEIQRGEIDGREARRFSLRLALVGGVDWPDAQETAP